MRRRVAESNNRACSVWSRVQESADTSSRSAVKKQVHWLHSELESIYVFLGEVADVPWDRLNGQVKVSAREVSKASYDMEDVLDTYLVRVNNAAAAIASNNATATPADNAAVADNSATAAVVDISAIVAANATTAATAAHLRQRHRRQIRRCHRRRRRQLRGHWQTLQPCRHPALRIRISN